MTGFTSAGSHLLRPQRGQDQTFAETSQMLDALVSPWSCLGALAGLLHQQATARVASGEADLGIAPQRQTPPELLQQSLMRDRIRLVCRPDHPLAARSRVTWAQALEHPFQVPISMLLELSDSLHRADSAE